MKKTVIIFVLAVLVLISMVIWGLNTWLEWGLQEILMVGVGLLLVTLAVMAGGNRIRSLIRKEPPEDELSRGLLTRASSLAFYISIYLWLILMYLVDRLEIETHTIIGAGIGGMALLFALSWIGLKFFGYGHE